MSARALLVALKERNGSGQMRMPRRPRVNLVMARHEQRHALRTFTQFIIIIMSPPSPISRASYTSSAPDATPPAPATT